MYEDDTPPAERRAQALSLDRDLLRELLGQEELRDLLDRGRASTEVERQLRGDAAERRRAARPAAPARRPARGRVRRGASRSRCCGERRALRVRVAGEERLIAAEDAGRYRDALGVMPPGGLPDAFLEAGEEPLRSLVAALRARPRAVHDRARRTSASAATSSRCCAALEREDQLVRGELRPGGTEREWCDPDVLRRLRRASLAALRREVEPVEQAALGRFLPSWHGIDRRATLREALVPLQALALPVALWESERAAAPRARLPAARSSTRSARPARSSGSAPGSTASRSTSARTRPRSAARPPATPPGGRGARRDPRRARPRAREFWHDLLAATGLEPEDALPALWDLVWAGEVTNDAWTPLRAGRRYGVAAAASARPRRFSRRRASAIDGDAGPLVARPTRLFAGRARPPRARRAAARAAGHRHARRRPRRGDPRRLRRGLRRAARARDARRLPPRLLRRGARRRAVRARRRGRAAARAARRATDEEPEPLVLAAADPAQPYGAALPWPKRAGARAARVAGAYVVLLGGEAALFVERGGRSLVPLRDPDETWLRPALAALVAHVRDGGAKRLAVERFDGEPVTETDVMPLLVEAGFLAGPRRAVLRP